MRQRTLVVGVALLGVVAVGGCSGDDDGGGGGGASATTAAEAATTTTAAAGGGGEQEVQLTAEGFKWDTTNLRLKAGTEYRVEVRNQDSAEHSFTFQEAGVDQEVEAGEDATVTFTAPDAGSYGFLCKYHPAAMKGTVTVT